MARLYLTPIVSEVFICFEKYKDDKKGFADCIRDVCDKERRVLLGAYMAILMKNYGLDKAGEEYGPLIQVGPIGGVFMMCIGCLDDKCRDFLEDIAEYVEGFPEVVATLITRDKDKLCVETLTWDRVRKVLM